MRWVGMVVCGLLVAALVAYLATIGLDRADKIASGIAAVLALLALVAPYLLPAPRAASCPVRVSASGVGAVAIGGDSSADVSTFVSAAVASGRPGAIGAGVSASGTASVAVGGTSTATIRSAVTNAS